jgi:hypothetical protein
VTLRYVERAAPVLAAIGAYVLLEGVDIGAEPEATPDERLAVWELVMTASVVAWTVLAGVGVRMLRDPEAATGVTSWRRVVGSAKGYFAAVYGAVAFPLVFVGLTGIGNPTILTGQQWKNVVLHLIGGAAILPLLVVVKQIHAQAQDSGTWSPTAASIARIGAMRRSLHVATAAVGAIIALAVIGTGALRDAVASVGLEPLPDTFVIVYGAWYTGVLAAIYLHAFGAVEHRARRILDDAAPLRDPTGESADAVSASVALRTVLGQELGLGGDARKNLEGLVVVMSPLIGAILTRLGGL